MKQNYLFYDLEDLQPKLTTIGFTLTEDERVRILEDLLELEERSPSESHLSLTVIKVPTGLRASLVVTSFSHVFRARTTRKNLAMTIVRVIEKMDAQFHAWKKYHESAGMKSPLPDVPYAS